MKRQKYKVETNEKIYPVQFSEIYCVHAKAHYSCVLMCTRVYTMMECSNLKSHKYKVVDNIQYYTGLLSEFHYVHAHAHYSCLYVHSILHHEGVLKSKKS